MESLYTLIAHMQVFHFNGFMSFASLIFSFRQAYCPGPFESEGADQHKVARNRPSEQYLPCVAVQVDFDQDIQWE